MVPGSISCLDTTLPFLYATYAAAKGPMALATSFAPCEKLSTMAVKIWTYRKNCSALGSCLVTLSWMAATFASVSRSLCVSRSSWPVMYDMPDFFFSSFCAGSASLVFSSSAASFRTPAAARSASALLAPTTSPESILFERVGTMAPAKTCAQPDEENAQPDEENAQPDEENGQPDEENAQPDEENGQPDENGNSENDEAIPCNPRKDATCC